MKKILPYVWILPACIVYAIGFNWCYAPNEIAFGGLTGIAQITHVFLPQVPIGTMVILLNIPLFLLGWWLLGKSLLVISLFSMAVSSICIDILDKLYQFSPMDPLLAAIYGGVICGLGLGLVFATEASTGGSDIIVRLLKRKWQHVPIGTISIVFDMTVAILTGIAFGDVTCALYSGVAIYLSGKIIDMVVYSFDNSNVAIIISDVPDAIARRIMKELDRGVTYLDGHGGYSHSDKQVILTAVKKYQLADLKRMVSELDPNAFVIVQEAHQVLGDGFSRYSKDSL